MGNIEYDSKGLLGVPYPVLHSDSVVLAGSDCSDFGLMGLGLLKTPQRDSLVYFSL